MKKILCTNRNYCCVCEKLYIDGRYPIHFKTPGHTNIVLNDQCTTSMIVETYFIKKEMKTELVEKIANEALYQLQYYKNLHLAHKKNIRTIFIFLSIIFISLIVIHVFFVQNFIKSVV